MVTRAPWPFPVGNRTPKQPEPGAPKDPAAVNPDVERSETGAVLGKPGKEHGAYGMVIDKSEGATPSPSEREIRGLAPRKD